MGAAVGIDLGTTNTVVAAVRDGRAVTLADDDGRRLIPSIVSFHPNGSVIVGEAARDRRLNDPTNTVYSVKRLIGRSWQSDEVQQARGRFPFELKEGAKNSTLVVARGENYALPEISAFVLRRAKAVAEKALGETVDRAVITVPANFNDLQRASTKVAGKLAGLEVLRILNEPTAAALAYGQTSTGPERLAVYDLGGGTFDITLLDLSGNVFEVLATAGDTALGGDDIDLVIADLMADQIVRTHRFDPRVDVTEFARLRIYAEQLKQKLSSELEARIEINDVGAVEGGKSVTIPFKMTRDQLERETASMIERTLDVCRFAIETVNLKVSALDRVILVGGPTRMPMVGREVEKFFQKPPALKVNPDEVVALGAAIQAHVLDRGRKRTAGPAQPIAIGAPPVAAALKTNVVQQVEPPPPASVAFPKISVQPPLQASAPAPLIAKTQTARAVPSIRSATVSAPRADPRAEGAEQSRPAQPRTEQPRPEAPRIEARQESRHEPPPEPPRMETKPPEGLDLFGDLDDPDPTATHTRPSPFPRMSAARLAPAPPSSLPPSHSFEPSSPVVPQRIVALNDLFPEPEALPPPRQQPAPPPARQAAPPPVDLLDLPKPDASPSPQGGGQGMSLPRSAPSLLFDVPEPAPAPPPQPAAKRPQVQPFAQFVPPSADRGMSALPAAGERTSSPLADSFAQSGGSLHPKIATPLLIDVTPLSLRVETVGGYCDVLITANTAVPCDRTRVFLTAADGQTTVVVRVAQGESNKFAENTFLGECELSGINPAPRGETQIGVTFEIDADGILNVKAKDVKSGRETQARLQLLGAQTEQKDVDEMMKRQAQHAVM